MKQKGREGSWLWLAKTVKIQGDLKQNKLKSIKSVIVLSHYEGEKGLKSCKDLKIFYRICSSLESFIVFLKLAREAEYLFTVKAKLNKFVHVTLKYYSP